jgi:hypothetical protein
MSKFTVDLGEVKLSEDQIQNINAAIQKAVAGELAKVNPAKQIVLIPVNARPAVKGNINIIIGIIAREFNEERQKQLGIASSGGFAEIGI